MLDDGALAPVPPQPGVEVQYPGRVLAVNGAQALQLDHELRDVHGPVPLAHPGELRHVFLVRWPGRADDGDGGASGEAAGQEDDPPARAHGDGGGALVGGGGIDGGELPGVPGEGCGVLPGGKPERPGVVGHAVERGAVASGDVGEGDAVVAVPEGLDLEQGGIGRGGGAPWEERGQVVGGGWGGEGGVNDGEVGGGKVEDAAELEGDEDEIGHPRDEHQVRRPPPPRHCPRSAARSQPHLRALGPRSGRRQRSLCSQAARAGPPRHACRRPAAARGCGAPAGSGARRGGVESEAEAGAEAELEMLARACGEVGQWGEMEGRRGWLAGRP